MSSPAKLRVLIAGGGVAGHCLAFWLSKTRLDISITVVERSPQPRISGQAIDIRGPAVDIIKLMKVEEAIKAQHTTETGLAFVDTSNKVLAQFDATQDVEKQSATSEYEILRADLAQILFDAIKDRDNIKYVYDESIKGFEQTPDQVNITFRSGKTDSFDFVVAADGATSKTRALIFDEDLLKDCYKPMGQYIGFFSIPHQDGDTKLWEWHNMNKGRMAAIRPHRNPETMGAYLCVTMPARDAKDPKIEEALNAGVPEQKALLQEYFNGAGWKTERLLEGLNKSDDFYMSRIGVVRLSKWTNGRASLLGDSAYATMGTGTSLAIVGAYVLAGEISKIASSKDVPQALEKFEEVLRPLVDEITFIPPGAPQIANPQTNWGLWVLNTLLWAVDKSKVYKLFGGFGEISSLKWTQPLYDWKDL